MKERVIEIILYLMQQHNQKGKGLSHFEELTDDLQSQGYTDAEINVAFYWLLERLRLQLNQMVRSRKSLPKKSSRILHTIENLHFSRTGYGYLIQLYQLGLIDDEQREQIIQRAMASGLEEIGELEVKALAIRLLLDADEGQTDSGRLWLLDESTDGTVH